MHEIFSHTGKISPNFSAIKWKNMFGYDMWLLMAPVNKVQNKMKKKTLNRFDVLAHNQ